MITAFLAWASGLFKINLTWVIIVLGIFGCFIGGYYVSNLASQRAKLQAQETILQSALDAQAKLYSGQITALQTIINQRGIDNAEQSKIDNAITADKGKSCPVSPVLRNVISGLR